MVVVSAVAPTCANPFGSAGLGGSFSLVRSLPPDSVLDRLLLLLLVVPASLPSVESVPATWFHRATFGLLGLFDAAVISASRGPPGERALDEEEGRWPVWMARGRGAKAPFCRGTREVGGASTGVVVGRSGFEPGGEKEGEVEEVGGEETGETKAGACGVGGGRAGRGGELMYDC